MQCPRCQGLCYQELLAAKDFYEPPGWMWACFNCGNRIDDRILQNRTIQEAERILADADAALWDSRRGDLDGASRPVVPEG